MSLDLKFLPARWQANLLLAVAIWAAGMGAHAWFTVAVCGRELLWPPAGLVVGAVLCCGLRYVAGIVAGVLLLAFTHEASAGAALEAVAECLLEASFAAVVLRWLRFDRGFLGVRNVAVFIGAAVVGAPLFGLATVGGARWALSGVSPQWMELTVRAIARMAGIGAVVPLLLSINLQWWRELQPMRRVLGVLLIGFGPVLILLEHGMLPGSLVGGAPFILLPLPLAAVLVLVYGLGPATLAVLLMELALVRVTAQGGGPFVQGTPVYTLIDLGGFMALLSGMTLLLGGIKRQRRQSEILALAAMNSARVAQWTWEDGRGLVLHDPQWADYFGARSGTAISPEQVNAVVHAGDRFSLRLWCGGAEELPPEHVEEFRLRVPDGGWRWVTSRRLRPVADLRMGRGLVHGVFQDVTERKEAEGLRLAAERRDAELRNLKLSIHPHFLFNSLNSLRSLIASRPAEAREFVTQLASFLHAAVAEVEQDLMPLARSLAVTGLYLGIERTRFGERLRVSVQASPEARAAQFPPLLLQTLVENAIKYGVAKRPEGGEIRIEAAVLEGRLRVAVSNDGRIVVTPEHSLGSGLHAADRRVKLLFGPEARVRLYEEPGPRVVAEVVVPAVAAAEESAEPVSSHESSDHR